MSSIAENISRLKHELSSFNAQLVAVSKTQPAELIMEACNCGHKIFGENYVQELVAKQGALSGDIEWHYIGHLQTNKVKLIVPFVSLIQSVDSIRLLNVINTQGQKLNRTVNCLLQVFIAREETKFGFSYNEVRALIQSPHFQSLHFICIKGLMGMATNTDDKTQVQKEFNSLKMLFNELKAEPLRDNFQPEILSTGMSSDYKIALEEGSNMVRIGSLIFGERITSA